MRQKFVSITQKLRLPSLCILCNQFHKDSLAACSFCIGIIKTLGTACTLCACPLPDDLYLQCGQCIKKPPFFDKAIVIHTFEEPLRSLLHQFKYHNGLYLTRLLCHLMLQAWQQNPSPTQCLIPVPMHPLRLRKRGFNQAALLAKSLAQHLNLPYDFSSCQKIINTLPQAQLNSDERQTNLKRAFFSKALPYQHVTLIDDLLTTGSTANELAIILKKQGVQRVDLWCCARTIKK